MLRPLLPVACWCHDLAGTHHQPATLQARIKSLSETRTANLLRCRLRPFDPYPSYCPQSRNKVMQNGVFPTNAILTDRWQQFLNPTLPRTGPDFQRGLGPNNQLHRPEAVLGTDPCCLCRKLSLVPHSAHSFAKSTR